MNCFGGILLTLLHQFSLEISETLDAKVRREAINQREKDLTSASCVDSVTNAMKSSQPAFRLIEFVSFSFNSRAPSLRVLASSNMVPALDLMLNPTQNRKPFMEHTRRVFYQFSKSTDSCQGRRHLEQELNRREAETSKKRTFFKIRW